MEPDQGFLPETDFVQILRTEWNSVCSKLRRRIQVVQAFSTAMTFAHMVHASLSASSINSMMAKSQPAATVHWLVKLMNNIDEFSAWHHEASALKQLVIDLHSDITSTLSNAAAHLVILNSGIEFRRWQSIADTILDHLTCQHQATIKGYQSIRDAYLLMRPVMMFQLEVDNDDLTNINIDTEFHLPDLPLEYSE